MNMSTRNDQNTNIFEISVRIDSERQIVTVLENAIGQKFEGDQLRQFLESPWKIDDRKDVEIHCNESFFPDLCNTIRDFSLTYHNLNLEKNLAIGQKIVQYI